MGSVAAALSEFAREAAVVNVRRRGHDGCHARFVRRGVGGAGREEGLVPVDHEVRADPHPAVLGREQPAQVGDDGLVLARREAEAGDRGLPFAVGAHHVEFREVRLQRVRLPDRDVDARVRGEDPSREEERDVVGGRLRPEVEDEFVRLGDPLEAAGTEGGDVVEVPFGERLAVISPGFIRGGDRSVSLPYPPQFEVDRGGGDEGLVHVDVDLRGMVHGDEVHAVHVDGLPQFLGDLHHVLAVQRLQHAVGEAPVFLRGEGGRVGTLAAEDAERHAEGALPHHVADELEPVAVPHVEHGTGTLEGLLFDEILVRAREVEILRDPVRPVDADDIGLEASVEADEGGRVGDGVDLEEIPGPHLDARPDPEAVVLAAPLAQPGKVEPEVVVRVAAVVPQ